VENTQVQNILAAGEEHEKLGGYDLYILSRLHGPIADEDPFYFCTGRIVYEIDDDLTDTHRDFGEEKWIAGTVERVNAITASTPYLAELMGRYDRPVFVCPNHLKTDFYRETSLAAERIDDRLTIGLVGTRTHWGDWIEVLPALKKIRDKYSEVQIVAIGYNPPYLENVIHAFYGGLPFHQYPHLLRQIDIRICPLDPGDEFNLSKSPISALEAMAAARPVGVKTGGAIPVCSDHPVFRGTVNRGNGRLVKDGAWFPVLEELIRDKKGREALAVKGHRWVNKERSLEQGVKHWAHAFRTIVGRT
jgi:glycosyltransferase involved in cell wall biosynthesis